MKLTRAAKLILGLGLLTGCRQDKSTDDPEILKQVPVNYFDGIKHNDHRKMTDAITDDFLLYENGHAWNNDSVYMNIERNSPFTVEFIFDNVKITVDDKSGHMTYDEHANFIFQDTIKANLNFLGSAAFRKSKEGWRMYFLQATKRFERKKK
jgi:hypothetical protein